MAKRNGVLLKMPPPGWHKRKTTAEGVQRRLREEFNVMKPIRTVSTSDAKAYDLVKSYLKETWAQAKEAVSKQRQLTEKQVEFYRLYALNGRRNVVKCMRQAGYKTQNDGALHQDGQRLLARDGVEDLLRAFEMEEKSKVMITVSDVVEYFKSIAMRAMEIDDLGNANRAMENLGKYLGMFLDKKEITHKVVHSREELDARIIELQQIVSDNTDTMKLALENAKF